MQTGLRSAGVQVQRPDIQKLATKYLLLESLLFSSQKNNHQLLNPALQIFLGKFPTMKPTFVFTRQYFHHM